MCGIVGILGSGPAAPILVDALKRLEYRGYDSAGVATLEDGHLTRRRAEGKLRNLEERLARQPLSGRTGIGHTRWATHGAPTEGNAHPARHRPAGAGPQRHHRELPRAARRARSRRRHLRDRHRHRSDRPSDQPQARRRHGARRGGPGGARPADRRLRAGHPLRRRGRPDDRARGAAARSPSATATARCISAPTRSRWRRSPTASPIWRTATGRC